MIQVYKEAFKAGATSLRARRVALFQKGDTIIFFSKAGLTRQSFIDNPWGNVAKYTDKMQILLYKLHIHIISDVRLNVSSKLMLKSRL
jgi:hypothetical protein